MFAIWWRSIVAKLVNWKSGSRNRRRRAKGPRVSSYRVLLETLEDRFAPATYIWSGVGDGTTWASAANWGGSGFPNAQDDIAQFNSTNSSGTNTITLGTNPITVGEIDFTGSSNYTISAGSGGSLTLNTSSGNPILSTVGGSSSDTISAPIALNNDANANLGASTTLTLTGGVTRNTNTLTEFGAGTLFTLNVLIQSRNLWRESNLHSRGGESGSAATGTVALMEGISTLGTGTLDGNGQTTITPSTTLGAALHTLTAGYGSSTSAHTRRR